MTSLHIEQLTANIKVGMEGEFSVSIAAGTDAELSIDDNGVTRPVFQLPVATFPNPDGLTRISGNAYLLSDRSGNASIDIAGALVEAGARAIVVSQGGRLVDELVALGGEHVTMPVGTKSPVGLYRNARRLAALMEREKADIIHARSRAPAWSALWAASWTGRTFLTTYHGAYNERTIIKNRYNSVMVRGRKVIANSQYTADLIRRRHPFATDRIVTIHRGTDLARFADPEAAARGAALRAGWGVAPDVPILLNIARLTPWNPSHPATKSQSIRRLSPPTE